MLLLLIINSISSNCPQSLGHITYITICLDAMVLPQPVSFYLFDLVKSLQFTSYPPAPLVSPGLEQHLSFPIYLVYLQKTYLPKHQVYKFSETTLTQLILYYNIPQSLSCWKKKIKATQTFFFLIHPWPTMLEILFPIQPLLRRTICSLI